MNRAWKVLLALPIALASLVPSWASATGAQVCRNSSFVGLSELTEAVHTLLGENTRDISKIKLFVSRDGDTTYIQSNFLSADPDKPGTYASYPTKLRTNEIRDLRAALKNIIYWDKLPPDASKGVERALRSVEVLVDRKAIDENGRVTVNLEGAKQIRLAAEHAEVATGEISTLPLEDPPPALVETIEGCCFKGRPPGRASEIRAALAARTINPSSVALLSMVVDSGTEAIIAKSPALSAAKARAKVERSGSWGKRLDDALKASKGSTLIVLSHINGKNVEVLDSSEKALFSLPVQELRDRAGAAGVDLILFGCDTASFLDTPGSIGISGRYNTATAAKRLEIAIKKSTNVADLLAAVASPDITLVAYDEIGGNGFVGASGFTKIPDEDIFRRVFRLLSFRGRR